MNAGDVCLHVGPISHGSGYLFMPTWLSGGVNLLLTEFDPGKGFGCNGPRKGRLHVSCSVDA